MKVKAVPAEAEVGAPVITNLVAAPADTVIAEEVEVIEFPVAVRVKDPAVFRVTLNVFVPATNAAAAGIAPSGSFEVRVTVLVFVLTALPKTSCAVTATENAVPETAVEGSVVNPYLETAPAVTLMEAEVIVRVPAVAVSVLVPEVFRVAVKVPTPFVRVAEAGRVAEASLEVMVTEFEKLVTVLLLESFAVTVNVRAFPAVAEPGTPVRTNWVATPPETVIAAVVTDLVPSVAEIVLLPDEFKVKVKVPNPLVRVDAEGSAALGSVDENETVPV